jgi:hypothetical protein
MAIWEIYAYTWEYCEDDSYGNRLSESKIDSNISEMNHVAYCYDYDKTVVVFKRRAIAW